MRALLNQMRGVVLAMRAIREVDPAARLVQTEDCGQTFGTRGDRATRSSTRTTALADLGPADRAGRRAAIPLWPFLDAWRHDAEELESFADQPCPPDVVGLNYYLTSDRFLDERLERYPPHAHGGNGAIALRGRRGGARPRRQGIVGHGRTCVDAWERYRLRSPSPRCTSAARAKSRCAGWSRAGRARSARARARRGRAGGDRVGAARLVSTGTRSSRATTATTSPAPSTCAAPQPRPTALARMLRALARRRRTGSTPCSTRPAGGAAPSAW